MTYEDDTYSRPLIRTCEYLGTTGTEGKHLFRFIDSDTEDELELEERQLSVALDLNGLISALIEFRDGKRGPP